ncbi:GDP-mannose 4,6-dehydratase [Paenibacillus xerothermodurans]|uniref:GDP-mannose 4,6 dehydratase n=1 Tax=Paenibacillus xerothermodurans TaxID=1977292 RepID=A0A2W1N8V1_PAEXE|nr:GDP-mannose 4,6-dehydratase [Paenibacillus xerothermodurans]PZE20817.1 GDP-mannose 4,6 dehydratase [Paenibacillus xerothermodurans]
MTRMLVTGGTGFVGTYMVNLLRDLGYQVSSTSHSRPEQANHFYLDLTNTSNVQAVIQQVKPTHIIHLAGQSSVQHSWKFKQQTFDINLSGTINLLDAILKFSPDCRVLSVGSSEEYGCVDQKDTQIDEMYFTRPMSPYGVSKLSSGLICMQYAKAYCLDIVHTRTFNHIGPGQSLGFVTQDFAQQIAQIQLGKRQPVIHVGNLESIRDFTDVRDIVKAYERLLFSSSTGEIFNVCSGVGIKMADILKTLIDISNVKINIQRDPEKMRPSDVPILVGNNDKITSATGWAPQIGVAASLADILHDRWSKEHAQR